MINLLSTKHQGPSNSKSERIQIRRKKKIVGIANRPLKEVGITSPKIDSPEIQVIELIYKPLVESMKKPNERNVNSNENIDNYEKKNGKKINQMINKDNKNSAEKQGNDKENMTSETEKKEESRGGSSTFYRSQDKNEKNNKITGPTVISDTTNKTINKKENGTVDEKLRKTPKINGEKVFCEGCNVDSGAKEGTEQNGLCVDCLSTVENYKGKISNLERENSLLRGQVMKSKHSSIKKKRETKAYFDDARKTISSLIIGDKEKVQKISDMLKELQKQFRNMEKSYDTKLELSRTIFDETLQQFEIKIRQNNTELRMENSKYQGELIKMQNIIDDQSDKLEIKKRTDEEYDKIHNLLTNLKLFNLNIGPALIEALEEKPFDNCLDSYFSKKYSNIKGFKNYTDQDRMVQFLETIHGLIQKSQQHTVTKFKELETILKSFGNNEGKLIILEETLNQCERDKKSLDIKLKNSTIELNEQAKTINEKECYIKELEGNFNLQSLTLNNLNSKYQQLLGDTTKILSWEMFQEKYPNISKEHLKFDLIDTLNYIELQNLVKVLVITLSIPVDKIEKKLPSVGITLMYEKNLLFYFANRLNFQFYNSKIDLKKYHQDAYQQFKNLQTVEGIHHSLEGVLDNLYKDITSKL